MIGNTAETRTYRKYLRALDTCRTLGSTKPDRAIEAGYRALAFAKQISQKVEASTMAHIAYLLARQKRSEEAEALIEKAVRIASSLRDPQMLARILGSRAAIYNNQGKPLSALRYFVRALRHIDQGTTANAGILDGLGQSLWQLGRSLEAIEYLLRAIEIYETQSGGIASAASYGTIASIYIELGDRKRGRQALRKTELAAKRTKDDVNLCYAQLAFGELELQSGRTGVAQQFLRRAERMALRLGTQRNYASALSLQGECARMQKKPLEAITLADRALEASSPDDAVLVRITHTRKADALFDLNRYEEAMRIYRDVAKLALGNNEQMLQISRKLAACFAATKNFRQAYSELRKQIGGFVESSKKQLSRVLVVERELVKLRRVATRNKFFREQEGARRIALGESLRQVERQRREIIRLEQRLPSNSGDSALMRGKKSRGKLASIPIQDLALSYPTLSPTELHICDLIRKSVSTKEIASILERSVRTVEWHRASIRRKLHLNRTQALEVKLI